MTLDDLAVHISFASKGVLICLLAGIEPTVANVERSIRLGLNEGPEADKLLAGVRDQVAAMRATAGNLMASKSSH